MKSCNTMLRKLYIVTIIVCTLSMCREHTFAENTTRHLTVGIMADMEPYESYDYKTGEANGIMKDYFELLSEKTGISFEYEPVRNATDMKFKINSGKIDIIASVADYDNNHVEYGLTLTDVCYSAQIVIVCENNENIETAALRNINESLVTGVIDRFAYMGVNAQKSSFKNVRYYSTYAECLDAIQDNEIAFALMPKLCADSLLEHKYYEGLKAYNYLTEEVNYCIGVSPYVDYEVVNILNQGIANISEDEFRRITTDNLIESWKDFDLRDVLYKYNDIIFAIIAVVIIILIFLIIRKLVSAEETDNGHFNSKLQIFSMIIDSDESIASNDMVLSRVSHEIRTPMKVVNLKRKKNIWVKYQ